MLKSNVIHSVKSCMVLLIKVFFILSAASPAILRLRCEHGSIDFVTKSIAL